jgi:hypothetical protein
MQNVGNSCKMCNYHFRTRITNNLLRESTKTWCSPTNANWFLNVFIVHLAQLN